jgi:hypothetical protein
MAKRIQLTIDCADPDRLAHFWANALGYQVQPPPAGYDSWEDWLREAGIPEAEWGAVSAIVDPDGAGPRFYFQRVPEPKTTKNRVHVDVNQGTRGTPPEERRRLVEAEAERLKALGATELYRMEEFGSHWVTMLDPEGNEFCVQ